MGLPFPPRQRPPHFYYPIFSTILMLSSIITICVWIHYTQAMIFEIKAALDVVGNNTAADNFFVLSQSVIATSILFLIYATVIYGLCLWRSLLEAEIDSTGEVKDKLHLYQMANLGVRVCWAAIMTWMVLLLAGCAIFGVYISNMKHLVVATLGNQQTIGGGPPRPAPYPDCPATCVDLWVVDYIDVPEDVACVCDPETLKSVRDHLRKGEAATPGCLTGVFLMYIVGGFWRTELSKHHGATRKELDVAARLASGGILGSAKEAGCSGRRNAAAAGGYRPLPRGQGTPRGGRSGSGPGRGGIGRGRGRGDFG